MNNSQNRPILIVEDSDADYDATVWALGKHRASVPHVRCQNGEKLIEYVENRGSFASSEPLAAPALVLLDLNLPRMNGREVLQYIRNSSHAGSLPVVMLTSSSNPAEVEACYREGANSYFLKPIDLFEYKKLLDLIVTYWVKNAVLPESRAKADVKATKST